MNLDSSTAEIGKPEWHSVTRWPDSWNVDVRRVIGRCASRFKLRVTQSLDVQEQLQVYCTATELPSIEAFLIQAIADESLRVEIKSLSGATTIKLVDSLLASASSKQ